MYKTYVDPLLYTQPLFWSLPWPRHIVQASLPIEEMEKILTGRGSTNARSITQDAIELRAKPFVKVFLAGL